MNVRLSPVGGQGGLGQGHDPNSIQEQRHVLSHIKTLSLCNLDCVYFLFYFSLQVTVKMYKRGSQGWLGKSLNATATVPSNTSVMFRISGEETDAKIPANTIRSITLSMWRESHRDKHLDYKYADERKLLICLEPKYIFTECLLLCSVCILLCCIHTSCKCLQASISYERKEREGPDADFPDSLLLGGNIMLMKVVSDN